MPRLALAAAIIAAAASAGTLCHAAPVAAAAATPIPAPHVAGISPAFAITDGKLSAGLAISGNPFVIPGVFSQALLLSLGGDINTSNGVEGGIVEADTESLDLPLATVVAQGVAISSAPDVSGTANLGTLAASGLAGAVQGGLLGQSFTVFGGFKTVALSLDSKGVPHATAVPTGAVQYASQGVSGAVVAGFAGTSDIGVYASGEATFGPLDGKASGTIRDQPTGTAGFTAIGGFGPYSITIGAPEATSTA